MKKCLSILLFMLLTMALCAASAETTSITLKARDVVLSRTCSALGFCPEDSNTYHLIDSQGQRLSDGEYISMSAVYDYPYFKVEAESEDGVHNDGLIDETGRVIIPPVYADIEVWSDRWAGGIKLVPSTADDKDWTFTNYRTNEKTFWRVDTVDFYYRGQLAGTLGRSDYGGTVTPRGDFICVQTQAREPVFYDSRMQRSPVAASGSSEYTQVRLNGSYVNVHQGSGQYAFTESCTLTEDQVSDAFLYDKAVLYDLQGQTVFTAAQNYDSVRPYAGDYALVSMNGLRGLIDRQGREVIPVAYKELGNYETVYLRFGYISAVKDGKFGFLDAAGNVTCPFVYSGDIVSNRGTFATVKNLDGTIIVLSAAVGELPDHYADVSFSGSYGSMAFVAENDYRQYSLIDIYGNTIIPFGDLYRYIYVNAAGTVAVAGQGNRTYDIYTLDIQPAEKPSAAAPAADADGTWTCENGHGGNTGKFCQECGAPKPEAKPADDGTWTCENGHAGNTGNFCQECGSPRPSEAPAAVTCPTCGAVYEGDAPKFCGECGTKLHD